MYLAELQIQNFRKLKAATVRFQPEINVIVGANNTGKTAIIDALRALLSSHDEIRHSLYVEDIHVPKGGKAAGDITFRYVFRDLSLDEEADFLPALVPAPNGKQEAHLTIRYGEADKSRRLRPKRWCGQHEEIGISQEMMENLRGVYLPPLRDADQGLRPSRSSQLARLLNFLSTEADQKAINQALIEHDDQLKKHLTATQDAVAGRHKAMLGVELAQALEIGLSASDFQRLAARLSLAVDSLDIESNGMGFNNLIYMAVVLSELAKNPDAAFRSLVIEEPEAHLHPQLQVVLLKYLTDMKAAAGEKPVQIFVTSHSPHFACKARLESLACLVETPAGIECFGPTSIADFGKGQREKLERYLDVTRAELFFAKRIIFVEGAAELILMNVLASRAGYDLRARAVSLISVEGLNFDCFLPLFGEKALKIPVSVITDADPRQTPPVAPSSQPLAPPGDESASKPEGSAISEESKPTEGPEPQAVYPDISDQITVSDATAAMKKREDSLVRVFHGQKTFEYDLALYEENRASMLKALAALHPRISKDVEKKVDAAPTNVEKAKALFGGMFERPHSNVQKGSYGQALAQVFLEEGSKCKVPPYIESALKHVCGSADGS